MLKNYRYTNIILWTSIIIVSILPILLRLTENSADGNAYGLSSIYFAFESIVLKPLYSGILLERFRSTLLATIPIALFIRLIGLSHFSVYIYSALCLIGTNILLYNIVKTLYNVESARLSILLFTLLPLNNAYLNGSLLADAYSSFYLCLNIFLIIKSFYTKNTYKGYFLIFAGIFTVISYLSRQWVPIVSFAAFVTGLFLIKQDSDLKKKLIYLLLFIIGLIIGIFLIIISFYALTGDYFYLYNLTINYSNSLTSQDLAPGYKFISDPLHVFKGLFNSSLSFYGILLVLILIYNSITGISKVNKFIIITVLVEYLFFEVLLRINLGVYLLEGYYSTFSIFIVIIIASFIANNNLNNNTNKILMTGTIFLICFMAISFVFTLIPDKAILDVNNFITKIPFPSSYQLNKMNNYVFAFIILVLFSVLIVLRIFIKKNEKLILILRKVIIIFVFISFPISLIISTRILAQKYEHSNEGKSAAKVLAKDDTGKLYYFEENYDPINTMHFEFLQSYFIEKVRLDKELEKGIIKLSEYEIYQNKLKTDSDFNNIESGYIIANNNYSDSYVNKFESYSIRISPFLIMNEYTLFKIGN